MMNWLRYVVLVAVWCALLDQVSSVTEEETGVEVINLEAKERQRTSLFVQYNFTKILSYMWDELNQEKSSKYSLYLFACWGDENPVREEPIYDEIDCLIRTVLSSQEAPRNEREMLEHLILACDISSSQLSSYGSPYNAGFNSLMECVRYEFIQFTRAILRKSNYAEFLKQYHADIDLPPSPGCEVNWMWYLSAFEEIKHAQAGQDSVLEIIFAMIGTTSQPFYVEIGYNAPYLTEGSNTLLFHEKGWDGLLIDGTHENHSINLHAHFVTPENIVDIFDQHDVPEEPDYVSIDIDSLDVWVARRLLSSQYRPRVVSIEYNCNFPIAASLAMPPYSDNPHATVWNQFDLYFGSTAGSIKMMAEEAGYDVVHFVGLHDMILVRRDLLGEDCPPPYARFSRRVGMLHSCVIDERRRGNWVEYGTFIRTNGDIVKSRQAALNQILPMMNVDSGPRSSPACLGLF